MATVLDYQTDDAIRAGWTRFSDPVRYLGFAPPSNFHRTHNKTCHLYCMRSGEFLKVGITDHVGRRLDQFRAGNPHGVDLVARRAVPASLARQIEKRVHLHFEERAIGREWFRDLAHQDVISVATPIIQRARRAVARWKTDGFLILLDA